MATQLLLFFLGAITVSNAEVTKIWKLSSRELIDYRAYRDVTVLHFRIPEQTLTAHFNFTVSEKLTSTQLFTGCKPRKVSLYLKYGSLPVINPDGAKFPDNFSVSYRVPVYRAEFQSDEVPILLNVSSPFPGDWFAAAFLSYTDPNNDQILQQGLTPSCAAMMDSSMSVDITEDITVIIPGEDTVSHLDPGIESKTFKFYVPSGTWKVRINVTSEKCENVPCIFMSFSPRAVPEPGLNNGNCDSDDGCESEFIPAVENWYYVTVGPQEASSEVLDFNLKVSFLPYNSTDKWQLLNTTLSNLVNDRFDYDVAAVLDDFQNFWTLVPLVRQSFSAFFTFNFLSEQADFNKGFFSINVSMNELAVMQFEVNYVSDIGGTLTFEMKLEDDDNLKNVTGNLYNVTVVACLSYQARAVPFFSPDTCLNFTGDFSEARLQVNTSNDNSRIGSIHVPFPEPGYWFITLKPFCYTNDSYPMECTTDLGILNVSLIIESNMCTADNCGRFGDCYNYMSGGFIFSTCVCRHGYIGWGCTDDSRVTSLVELLVAALLLTLSNMFFIPAVVMAIRRKYYTEALVYACTMFFSTFYHACDAGEDIYSYCLMRLNVLQFCDFYSAILSLWVTLIAMSDVGTTLKSIAHMAGAVGIALGTEYNRTSLWVLVVPALVGIAIMTQSWIWRCKSLRSCYPSVKYWKFYFPPGVLLVTVGLVCYSFLQTKQNYKFVHSAWHIIMALAIIFLLPARKQDSTPVINTEDFIALPTVTCVPCTRSSWKENKFLKLIRFWER
ncbi:hypothetical protein L9F63_017501 [Diploptera punctata]|uniref:EGF-like domain-containing protein n=1 Tax=Diploptera punctata TaxID=6984 RepID=A0AAD7ZZX1_DIPPU|nr:hypothetical protein L9F63_017501 [Diploptera punctata]